MLECCFPENSPPHWPLKNNSPRWFNIDTPKLSPKCSSSTPQSFFAPAGRFRATLDGFGRIRANLGQVWPRLDQCWRNLRRHDIVQVWPSSARRRMDTTPNFLRQTCWSKVGALQSKVRRRVTWYDLLEHVVAACAALPGICFVSCLTNLYGFDGAIPRRPITSICGPDPQDAQNP